METTNRYCRYGRRLLYGIGLIFVLVLAAEGLQAQQSPLSTPLTSDEPIQITSDTLEADNRNQTFLFKGNVKVIQGSTEITSERLKVWYKSEDGDQTSAEKASRIRDIQAEGNVVILFDGRTAKCEKALYSAEKETLTLTGENATIIDKKNTIRGSKITLYRTQDRITVEGDRKGRVEAVIFPDNKDSNN